MMQLNNKSLAVQIRVNSLYS